jgi:hypothetical protein
MRWLSRGRLAAKLRRRDSFFFLADLRDAHARQFSSKKPENSHFPFVEHFNVDILDGQAQILKRLRDRFLHRFSRFIDRPSHSAPPTTIKAPPTASHPSRRAALLFLC